MDMEIVESGKKKLRIQIRIPFIFAKTEKKRDSRAKSESLFY